MPVAIHTNVVIDSPESPKIAALWQFLGRTLLRKLWLPRAVYELIPVFYIILGIAGLFTSTYVLSWTWVMPYAILLACLLLHTGVMISIVRVRFRRDYHRRHPDRAAVNNVGSN